MADDFRLRGPNSLLARTNLILAVSAVLIAASATFALNAFVIDPIRAQSADDEAALLVLSAQTWAELPPTARPYFELEMAENHDLIITEAKQILVICYFYHPSFMFTLRFNTPEVMYKTCSFLSIDDCDPYQIN